MLQARTLCSCIRFFLLPKLCNIYVSTTRKSKLCLSRWNSWPGLHRLKQDIELFQQNIATSIPELFNVIINNIIDKSLKSNQSSSAWVLKKYVEATAEGKQLCLVRIIIIITTNTTYHEMFTSYVGVPGKRFREGREAPVEILGMSLTVPFGLITSTNST